MTRVMPESSEEGIVPVYYPTAASALCPWNK
jgi:hypothetical protein